MKTHKKLTREEFEEKATNSLQEVVTISKQMREHLRRLEKEVGDKEEKIRGYQNAFFELETKLVKIQAILYVKGTT